MGRETKQKMALSAIRLNVGFVPFCGNSVTPVVRTGRIGVKAA
jgi:hypothetical protein